MLTSFNNDVEGDWRVPPDTGNDGYPYWTNMSLPVRELCRWPPYESTWFVSKLLAVFHQTARALGLHRELTSENGSIAERFDTIHLAMIAIRQHDKLARLTRSALSVFVEVSFSKHTIRVLCRVKSIPGANLLSSVTDSLSLVLSSERNTRKLPPRRSDSKLLTARYAVKTTIMKNTSKLEIVIEDSTI